MNEFQIMFDIDQSKMIDVTSAEYFIYGKTYIVEISLHKTKESDILPFAILEEGFHQHKQVSSKTSFTKTKDLAFDLIKTRQEELDQRQDQ